MPMINLLASGRIMYIVSLSKVGQNYVSHHINLCFYYYQTDFLQQRRRKMYYKKCTRVSVCVSCLKFTMFIMSENYVNNTKKKKPTTIIDESNNWSLSLILIYDLLQRLGIISNMSMSHGQQIYEFRILINNLSTSTMWYILIHYRTNLILYCNLSYTLLIVYLTLSFGVFI